MDLELHEQGKKEDDTKANKEALDIINDHTNRWLNARQVLLKYKMPHGSGTNPQFPHEARSTATCRHRDKDFFVDIYRGWQPNRPYVLVGSPWRFRHVDAQVELSRCNGTITKRDLLVWSGSGPDGVVHEDGAHGVAQRSGHAHQEQLRHGQCSHVGQGPEAHRGRCEAGGDRATASESGARMAAQTQDSSRSGMTKPFGKALGRADGRRPMGASMGSSDEERCN